MATRINRHRLALLGHVLRREGTDASRAVSLDRFAMPRVLGGPNRVGQPRQKWTDQVMGVALKAAQGTPRWWEMERDGGHPYRRVAVLAQDRDWWRKCVKDFRGRLN